MSAVLTYPVLTLNKIFAPIRVIAVRRALSLLVTGRGGSGRHGRSAPRDV